MIFRLFLSKPAGFKGLGVWPFFRYIRFYLYYALHIVRTIQCLLIPNSYFDWRYMTVFRFPYLCVPWLCVPYIFCSQPLLRKHLDFHTFMYPVVMYHIPNFFPVYFPTYFPSDFLLKKVEKRNFLTNIIGFSCCFLLFHNTVINRNTTNW